MPRRRKQITPELARERAHWQRRRRTLFKLTAISLVVGVAVGVLNSDVFQLRTIYLDGPRRDLLVQVKPLLSGLGWMSTALCSTGDLAKLARQCSLVADVKIRRGLPHEIYMHIDPRHPAAAVSTIQNPNDYLLLDRHGLPYEAVRRQGTGNVVRLRAFPTKSLLIGQDMPQRPQELYEEVLGGIDDSGMRWRAFDFGKGASAVGYLWDGPKVKIGGLDNLRRKLAIAGWAWRDAKAKGMKLAYVDVRLPRRATIMPITHASAPAAPAHAARAAPGKSGAKATH